MKIYSTETVIIASILTFFSVGFFGAFGALVHYLFTVVKNNSKFSFGTMLIFFILGFFIAILANSLMLDFWGKSYEGLLLLSGFLVFKILDFLDVSGLSIILKKAGIKTDKDTII